MRGKALKLPAGYAPDPHPGGCDVFNEFKIGSGDVAEISIDEPGVVMAVPRHSYRKKTKFMETGQSRADLAGRSHTVVIMKFDA